MTPTTPPLHPRARLTPRYALLPLDGYPPARLPNWPGAEVRVLCGPAMGAGFAEYLIDLPAGASAHHPVDGAVGTFLYVLSGRIDLDGNDLKAGGYAFVPHSDAYALTATEPTRLVVLRKRYEPAAGVGDPYLVIGNAKDVESEPFLGDPGARLQLLLPDDPAFDLAMNVFTFDPGHRLPTIETHVMEHGLVFLSGGGVYYLGDEWMEAGEGDFIWMAPFCPQGFYAAGPGAAKYLYYKNVNRDVAL